jgi:curved DNA-binding protein CbpA
MSRQGVDGSTTMPADPMYPSLLPYSPERDVYRLLQVEPNANREEISAACRRLARTFHPDHNRSERANEEMRIVNAVRHLLSDPSARAAYDGARRRFLYDGYRPEPTYRRARVVPPAASVQPFKTPLIGPSWRTRAMRLARAVAAGMRGVLAEFEPPRCPTCRELIEVGDRYCAACGDWLGRTEKLPGA